MARQMWGDIFGAFKDQFGVDWMVDVRAPQS
jgi:PhnB protein